jgi:hypothetical protein
MGGIVTTLAGEILGEERMLAYGRRRLAEVVAEHRRAGGFQEYNSPTYTRVVLWDCEQALRCIRDPEALGSVDYLFRNAWKTVADHFHPVTGQWAGPHSRDYTLFMTRELARYLAFKTGVAIHENPAAPTSTKVPPLVGWIVESGDGSSKEARSAIFFRSASSRVPAGTGRARAHHRTRPRRAAILARPLELSRALLFPHLARNPRLLQDGRISASGPSGDVIEAYVSRFHGNETDAGASVMRGASFYQPSLDRGKTRVIGELGPRANSHVGAGIPPEFGVSPAGKALEGRPSTATRPLLSEFVVLTVNV